MVSQITHTHSLMWEARFQKNKDQVVSILLPYCGLILTVCCVVTFLARYYLIEPMVRKFYKQQYTGLSEAQKRSFINHHIAAGSKLVLLCLAAYPTIAVLGGIKTLHSSYAPGSRATIGDVLIIVTQVFTSMYVFELFYRERVSYISVLHHVGAIIIAQTATVLGLDQSHRSDATIEFILCLLWGMFDVIAEFWPHVAMIIYRIRPDSHRLLSHILLSTTILELVGTLVETITVMAIFGLVWDQWTIEFKVLTPILHILFSIAQLWGAWIFWGMYKQQLRKVRNRDGGSGSGNGSGKHDTEKGIVLDETASTASGSGSGKKSDDEDVEPEQLYVQPRKKA